MGIAPRSDCARLYAIADFLRAIHDPGTCFEIRSLGAQSHGGFFDNPYAAASQILKRNAAGCRGIYFTVNPLPPGLLTRGKPNRLQRAGKGSHGKDKDVSRRTTLFIDIDPQRPRDASATDEEKHLAADVCQAVRIALESEGWPTPIEVDSGNGQALFYRIDLPNDDESLRLVKRVLAALGAKFGTDAVKIDPAVCNASRIARVPWTMNRKGENLPDRPHRQPGACSRSQESCARRASLKSDCRLWRK